MCDRLVGKDHFSCVFRWDGFSFRPLRQVVCEDDDVAVSLLAGGQGSY